jgi:hypothetical protein
MSGLSFDEVMNLWVKAGGSPQSAAMAAAVADASSGLNPSEVYTDGSGLVRRGLFQIPASLNALSSIDPLVNAKAAVLLSNNGNDFSKWCSAWSDNACGSAGGQYLGAGSNALAALRQRGGTYQQVNGSGVTSAVGTNDSDGSTVTDNTGDSSSADTPVAATAPAPAAASSKSKVIVLIVLALLLGFVWYSMNKKGGAPKPTVSPEA